MDDASSHDGNAQSLFQNSKKQWMTHIPAFSFCLNGKPLALGCMIDWVCQCSRETTENWLEVEFEGN